MGLQKTKVLATKHEVSVHTVRIDLIEDTLPCARYDAAIMVYGHFPREDQFRVLEKIAALAI